MNGNTSDQRQQCAPAPMPPRIVLIEDNPGDTLLLRHALDDVGVPYVLEVLTDGEAALEFVREHCRTRFTQPCLIILDLHLPRYDGATILRAIRADPELAKVAVAVLTDSPSPVEKAEVLRLGVQAFRVKSMNLEDTFGLARDLIHICTSAS
jgi:CheY-like chemotaxis protein